MKVHDLCLAFLDKLQRLGRHAGEEVGRHASRAEGLQHLVTSAVVELVVAVGRFHELRKMGQMVHPLPEKTAIRNAIAGWHSYTLDGLFGIRFSVVFQTALFHVARVVGCGENIQEETSRA